MSIVAMKHLRLIAVLDARDGLLRDLSRLGCLEIKEPDAELAESLHERLESNANRVRSELGELEAAMETIRAHTGYKRGLFAPRIPVDEAQILEKDAPRAACEIAEQVNALARELQQTYAEEGRLQSRKDALAPWRELDVPLETASGAYTVAQFGVVPSIHAFAAVEEAAPQAVFYRASSDNEQHYFLLVCHKDDWDEVLEALRPFGFSKTQFKDCAGTAAENIAALEDERKRTLARREELCDKIAAFRDEMETLQIAYDACSTQFEQESAREQMLATRSTFFLEGWFPADEEARVVKCLEKNGCAYELRDPTDDEEPPILTRNARLVAPFGMITNMYSPPAYRGFDPNFFMAIFFSIFFGIMFSDAGYGLLLLIACAVVLGKFKPRGAVKDAVIIGLFCGITTFIWGALFGGVFGDTVPTVYQMCTGKPFDGSLALWFDPLKDPMKMLIFSFILGGIHLFAGMAIQAYLLIRAGKVWDAVFDIGFWWVLLGGAVLALVGVPGGLYVLLAGALGLLLTQGRHQKNVFKKLTSGLGALYNVTSYLGDILSYSRLLALSLATAVIASVVNTMGALTGPIGFLFVFLIGHVFNIAVSLIGTFVHTSRLQYVEFFGKFYEGGGELFRPLQVQTKYVDILKEEH